MTNITVGIDLAKNVFAVHGVDETGKPGLGSQRFWEHVYCGSPIGSSVCLRPVTSLSWIIHDC
jgi:hypothetical protein